MSAEFDVVVVGGGPAGSACAISIADRGYSVQLVEKNASRSHKLCGEFLSPDVLLNLRRLGLEQTIVSAGAQKISRLRIVDSSGVELRRNLPLSAAGISRAELDERLLAAASRRGVHVVRGVAAASITGDLDNGFEVACSNGAVVRTRLAIAAFGRQSSLDPRPRKAKHQQSHNWVAFKSHFDRIDVADVIELFLFERGYCGLSMVENGQANVCWIMASQDLQAAGGKPLNALKQALASNGPARDRLAPGEPVFERFLSVSGLSFSSRGCFAGAVPVCGDAAGMIAPLCGDGIAMAVESAGILAGCAADYLDGAVDAVTFRQVYYAKWNNRFKRRLWVGRRLQSVLMNPSAAARLLTIGRAIPGLTDLVFRTTRGRLTPQTHEANDP